MACHARARPRALPSPRVAPLVRRPTSSRGIAAGVPRHSTCATRSTRWCTGATAQVAGPVARLPGGAHCRPQLPQHDRPREPSRGRRPALVCPGLLEQRTPFLDGRCREPEACRRRGHQGAPSLSSSRRASASVLGGNRDGGSAADLLRLGPDLLHSKVLLLRTTPLCAERILNLDLGLEEVRFEGLFDGTDPSSGDKPGMLSCSSHRWP